MASILDAFHDFATLSGSAACAVGIYGSYQSGSAVPLAVGTAFSGVFALARSRIQAGRPAPPYQGLLVLALVVLSFALHIVYLPAGLCCFAALLLCKNELLLPSTVDVDVLRAKAAQAEAAIHSQPTPPQKRTPKAKDQ